MKCVWLDLLSSLLFHTHTHTHTHTQIKKQKTWDLIFFQKIPKILKTHVGQNTKNRIFLLHENFLLSMELSPLTQLESIALEMIELRFGSL